MVNPDVYESNGFLEIQTLIEIIPMQHCCGSSCVSLPETELCRFGFQAISAVTDTVPHMRRLLPAHVRHAHLREAFAFHPKAASLADPSYNAGPRRVRVPRACCSSSRWRQRLSPASRTAHPTAGLGYRGRRDRRKREDLGRLNSVLVATTRSCYLHFKLKTV